MGKNQEKLVLNVSKYNLVYNYYKIYFCVILHKKKLSQCWKMTQVMLKITSSSHQPLTRDKKDYLYFSLIPVASMYQGLDSPRLRLSFLNICLAFFQLNSLLAVTTTTVELGESQSRYSIE